MTRLRTIKNWPELARTARYQVKTLAKICEVSPRQLERFFLGATGLRAHEWMYRLRQFEALRLLRKLGSVKATAHHLGYKQPSHFSVKFRSYYGIWPSEFLTQWCISLLDIDHSRKPITINVIINPDPKRGKYSIERSSISSA